MDAHDAFGHDESDDPLESLGWSGASTPPRYTPPPRGPRLPAGPSRAARLAALVAVAVVIGGVWAQTHFRFHELSDIKLPSIAAHDAGPPPVGLSQHSMLRRGNLAPALRQLQEKLGGRLKLLRIEAARVDVQVVGDDGKVTLAQRRWDADGPSIIAETPGGAGADTFPWSAVNASAPARLVRKATTRRTQDFNYAVLLNAAGLRWSGYLIDGRGFLANARGLHVTPLPG